MSLIEEPFMHKRRLVALSTLSALVLAGCSGVSDDSGPKTYAKDGTFILNMGIEDPGTFDPYRNPLISSVTGLTYDSLLNWQPDGTFASGLAEDWQADVNGATFTLRDGVTCADGSPLTATHVADVLTFLADPANGSTQYGTTIPTVPFSVTPDDQSRTVSVTMSSPYGFVLNTIGLAPIVCSGGMQDPSILQKTSSGTGPFVLTEYQPGDSITFERREGYTWGPDGAGTSEPGTPAKIVMKFVTNGATAANLILSDQLNAAIIRGPERKRLDNQGLKKVDGAIAGQWVWFNQLGGRPAEDVHVREALMTSLDIPQLIQVSTGGFGAAAEGLIAQRPTVCPGNPLEGMMPERDVAAAAALLDQVGWTREGDGVRRKGGNALRLAVHYVPSVSDYAGSTAELLAQEWQGIGVETTLVADTITSQSQAMFQDSNWDVYLAPFGANLPSQMVPYLSGQTPPTGVNLAGIDNAEYNDLVVKAQAVAPPEACANWHEAEHALYRGFNPVPISTLPNAIYLNKAEAMSNSFQLVPTSFRVLE